MLSNPILNGKRRRIQLLHRKQFEMTIGTDGANRRGYREDQYGDIQRDTSYAGTYVSRMVTNTSSNYINLRLNELGVYAGANAIDVYFPEIDHTSILTWTGTAYSVFDIGLDVITYFNNNVGNKIVFHLRFSDNS